MFAEFRNGVAVGAGAHVACEAAAVVLVRADVRGVVVALDLSRATFRRIQANFCWAMGYNLVLVPLAAGLAFPLWRLRLPPALAGLAMAMSSVSVVLSSLALKAYAAPVVRADGTLGRRRRGRGHSRSGGGERAQRPPAPGRWAVVSAALRKRLGLLGLPLHYGPLGDAEESFEGSAGSLVADGRRRVPGEAELVPSGP